MGITNDDIQKALRIKRVVTDYLKTSTKSKVQAKELMDSLIDKKVFAKNNQDGQPIREFLRHLERENHLHLIPQAYFEQKAENKNWYFIKSKV